jgi:hypothetical protein
MTFKSTLFANTTVVVFEKNRNLVYEVVADVLFGHEHVHREFWITKLSRISGLVTP